MTDQQHPIIPPHDQVYQWWEEACKRPPNSFHEKLDYVAEQAACWGADQELEACGEYLTRCAAWEPEDVQEMRAARRPKPPSLAEEALKEVGAFEGMGTCDLGIIRRALKRLQELEGQGDG